MTPETMNRVLQAYDPLLRVRWGNVAGKYVIERKAVVTSQEVYYLGRRADRYRGWVEAGQEDVRPKYVNTAEAWESAKCGHRIIIIPEALDQRAVNNIMWGDIQNYGGYAAFADMLDAQEEKRDNAIQRTMSEKRKVLNAEVYDMMSFVNRRRDADLGNGQMDLTYMLHGRHKREGDAPLITLAEC